MSAINPASFQTPTSSLGLQPIYSGTGLGVQNAPINEQSYDDSREINYNAAPRPSAQNVYAGFSPSMSGYGANYAAASDPFAGYNQYGMMQPPRQSGFGLNRQPSLPRNGQFTSPHALTNSFGNLSLDRYEPTTSS